MENNRKKSISNLVKLLILITVIVTLVVILNKLGIGESLEELKGLIENLGLLGLLVFVIIYAFATLLLIPGSAMTILAGTIFGSVLGIIVVSIASTAGATLSFLVARYFARASIEKWLEKQDKFKELDKLTEKHGSIIVAITRLVPFFPYTLLNYGFGLTKIPLKIYVLWSWICMLPGTIMYVVGSDTVVTAVTEKKVPWVLLAVFFSIVAIIAMLVHWALKELKK